MMQPPLCYPPAPRADQVDSYDGMPVADPYRWLEDGTSAQVQAWLGAQQDLAEAYLGGLPAHSAILSRLQAIWAAMSAAQWPADSTPGADAGVVGTAPSPDGALLAYGLALPGQAVQTWRIRDMAGGHDLPDELINVVPGAIFWANDGRGFFYSAAEQAGPDGAALRGCVLCYHRVGTPQPADRLVYAHPELGWSVRAALSDDGSWLVAHAWPGSDVRTLLFAQEQGVPEAPLVPLVRELAAGYQFIGSAGRRLWFLSDAPEAPRGRLVAIDPQRPARGAWQVVEAPDGVVFRQALVCGERLVVLALIDASPTLLIYDSSGQPVGSVATPGIGTIDLATSASPGGCLLYSFSSTARPPAWYQVDPSSGRSEFVAAAPLAWDPNTYLVERSWYQSRDGTAIPIFLSYRRGLWRDGDRPTVLQVYGGFGEVNTPVFVPEALAWMELGGIWAQPCLRGGGEYGRLWQLAAAGRRRQVAIDDALAGAEWLIAQGLTCPGQLAIVGRSHGGMTAGACVAQRPGLFGAAIVEAGVLDLLRFDQLGAGAIWRPEYGWPASPGDARALQACSPLHRLRHGTVYPATLVLTAPDDQWVAPAHSYKFAAALQATQCGTAPALLYQTPGAGHGPRSALTMLAAKASWLAFLCRALDIDLC